MVLFCFLLVLFFLTFVFDLLFVFFLSFIDTIKYNVPKIAVIYFQFIGFLTIFCSSSCLNKHILVLNPLTILSFLSFFPFLCYLPYLITLANYQVGKIEDHTPGKVYSTSYFHSPCIFILYTTFFQTFILIKNQTI